MVNVSNFQQANDLLTRLAPRGVLSGGYNLDRMKALMRHLGNPQNNLQIIHVAGTSGKTSTAYFIASLLKEAGFVAGLTVSPHIDEVNERIQINLETLPEVEFCRIFSEFYETVQKAGLRPTYFEFLIAMAYWYFDRTKVDYAVVEVGLGGLLDGTNVIDRRDKICVITDIGMDHMDVLGKTIIEISEQKAGIITYNNEVFCNWQDKQILDILERRAEELHAKLHVLKNSNNLAKFEHLFSYQQRNWDLAYAVFRYVCMKEGRNKLNERKLMKASRLSIPGRMEIVNYGDKTIVFDGAHNFQKMQALTGAIGQRFQGDEMAVLFALSKDYGQETMHTISQLSLFPKHIILTSFENGQDTHRKPIDPYEIGKYLDRLNYEKYEIIEDPKKALEALLKRPEPVLVVTGSFFLLNTVRKLMQKGG